MADGTRRRATAEQPLLSLMRAPRRRARAFYPNAEYGTLVAVCRFMAWAQAQENFPTPEAVQERFGCCRATAYRWLNALADAYCIEPPWRAAA